MHLPIECFLNGALIGDPNGAEMHFSFYDLIAHATKTRPLSAGTMVGSGTFSNQDEARGVSCLAEKRVIEQIKTGTMTTPFLTYGDSIELDMRRDDRSIFGRIRQKVVRP